MSTIEHIYIAEEPAAQMKSVTCVTAIADCGLKGDRYEQAQNRNNSGNQVTLIEIEHIEAFVSETGLAMAPGEPRRNLVTRGVALNALAGKRFYIDQCEFEGVELCEPCAIWARNTHKEVARFFVHRGGLNARIITGGPLCVGSPIKVRA